MPYATKSVLRAGLCAVTAVVLLASCSHYRPLALREPANFAETGSIHAAVVSVVPFEAVSKSLAPSFKLDADTALTAALVTTQNTQTAVDQASQLLATLAFPGAKPPDGAAAGSTGSTTAPTVADARLPTSTLTPGAPAQAPTLGQNAVLKYQLATALLQEVTMLENYVRDAPRRQGYAPFLVRLQVAVRPRARATPFDAQADIEFDVEEGQPATDRPVVIPLLATDNIDLTSISSMQRNLTQLGLAISALKGPFGFGAALGNRQEDLVSALGWQYDSVTNVARLNEHTISLRASAQPTGVKRFELMPRVHSLTALLLVKQPQVCDAKGARKAAQLRFRTHARFLHAVDGKVEQQEEPTAADTGIFQASFWPQPTLPSGQQIAPLTLTRNEKSQFARLSLRGGANLVLDQFLGARVEFSSAVTLVANTISLAGDRSRDELQLQLGPLSDKMSDFLAGLGVGDKATVQLTLNPELTQSAPEGCYQGRFDVGLDVIDQRADANPAPKDKALVSVSADKQMRVDGQGNGTLRIQARFPKATASQTPPKAGAGTSAGNTDAVVVKLGVSFEGVLLDVGPSVASGAKGCAVADKGQLIMRGDCLASVQLHNLPLPGQDTATAPVLTLKFTEYSDEATARPVASDPLKVTLVRTTPSVKQVATSR